MNLLYHYYDYYVHYDYLCTPQNNFYAYAQITVIMRVFWMNLKEIYATFLYLK